MSDLKQKGLKWPSSYLLDAKYHETILHTLPCMMSEELMVQNILTHIQKYVVIVSQLISFNTLNFLLLSHVYLSKLWGQRHI